MSNLWCTICIKEAHYLIKRCFSTISLSFPPPHSSPNHHVIKEGALGRYGLVSEGGSFP